jgi:gentisate 1,2-dioxygenase
MTRQAFYDRLGSLNLSASWLTPNRPDRPRAEIRPWLWPWKTLRPEALSAIDMMPEDVDVDRRVISMRNPTGALRTLTAGVQIVAPGELSCSHRHSMAALRFILEGEGAVTIVEGEPLTMEPGDFLLTPAWCWHGHVHNGRTPMMWLDVLDAPFVRGMDWQFFEEFSAPKSVQSPEKLPDESALRYGANSMLPIVANAGSPAKPYSPLFSYKWRQSREALYRLTAMSPDPYDGFALDFINPVTGGPVMPTIGASMHLVTAGQVTKARRSTANRLYHVAEGSGFSILDGLRFDWERGDTFCVPTWCWQEHGAAAADAILFSVSDRPILDALALYREETYAGGGHQAVTGRFDASSPGRSANQASAPTNGR